MSEAHLNLAKDLPDGWIIVRACMFNKYLIAKRDGGWATLFISKPDEQGNWVSEKPLIQLHSSCLEKLGQLFPDN